MRAGRIRHEPAPPGVSRGVRAYWVPYVKITYSAQHSTAHTHTPYTHPTRTHTHAYTEDALLCVQAGFATSLLHLESRVASALGQGFYTIGPAGEELMSAVGLILNSTDAMALHYRHLATQVWMCFC